MDNDEERSKFNQSGRLRRSSIDSCSSTLEFWFESQLESPLLN